MAKIDSSGCIRRIAWRSLAASRTRSLVAVAAIALTALMLTAMATIAGTVMDAYQLSTFRQSGGDMHGTFKNVTPEQIDVLSSDPLVKRPAVRRLLGVAAGDAFRKVRCEVGYMDEACAQGQFLVCEQGSLPREGTREVACDTRVLSALGVEPKIGEQVTLSVNVGDDGQEQLLTDTFTLCGYWTYDPRAQVSQILLPLSYVNAALEGQEKTRQGGLAGRWDLNVYLQSSAHIEADMLAILERNGYQAEDSGADDYVQIGVNWAYLSAQMSGNADMETVAIVAVLLLVVVMTGYLIINNLFCIAVVGDIRSFGLLKTIGVTPKQLRRLVRAQAMIYCLAGIPLGLAAGYLVGALLAPFLCERLSYDVPGMGAKVNPSVFLVSALFAVVTVLVSCGKPARIAARVSPVEAVRFTQERGGGKKRKRGRAGARILPMALANLGRNRGRTVLVVLSLSLAVVLLQVVTLFISGFDMNKYLQRYVVSDFVMADANSLGTGSSIFDESIALAREDIDAVMEQSGIVRSTVVYGDPQRAHAFLTEEQMRAWYSIFNSEETVDAKLALSERNEDGLFVEGVDMLGMEPAALALVSVWEGDLAPLSDPEQNAIAVVYEKEEALRPDRAWNVGDEITIRYVEQAVYVDPATGEEVDPTLGTACVRVSKVYRDVTYTVAALIDVPYPLGYTYSTGYGFVLGAKTYIRDSGTDYALKLLVDVDEAHQKGMQAFMEQYAETVNPAVDFQSRQGYAKEFDSFRALFMLFGGTLSFVVALVGVLNFFNASVTSIMARRREFAVLSAVGMTGRQLTGMLIAEGVMTALMSLMLSLMLSLALCPLMGRAFGVLFFYTYRMTFAPFAFVTPSFLLMGALIPTVVCRFERRKPVARRLRVL